MKPTSHVVTIRKALDAYLSAFDAWQVELQKLSDSVQSSLNPDRILGDGQGPGFGDRIPSPPFISTQTGWHAWNPVLPADRFAADRSLATVLSNLLGKWDTSPPEGFQGISRVRWVTTDREPGFERREIARIRPFLDYFYDALLNQKLPQDNPRQSGVFKKTDRARKFDKMRTRTQPPL